MPFKKPLKTFLFPAVNVLFCLVMLAGFFIAGRNVEQTFSVAHISALGTLKPPSMDYLWQLNIDRAPLDKGRLRYYMDFYENLLQVYPFLTDIYGILGYGYYYLGDEVKAVEYLKKAILFNPLYSWNYFNLAVIDIDQSRYQDACALLRQLLRLDPFKSLQRMCASQYVYAPLIKAENIENIKAVEEHLKLSFVMSYNLLQIMDQVPNNPTAQSLIKKMNLGIYAF